MGTEKRERQKANRALKHQQMEQQASRRKYIRYGVIAVVAIVGVFLIAWIASNFVGDDDPATPTDTVAPITLPVEPVTSEAAVTVPSTAGG